MAIDTIGANALATSAVTTAKIAADAVTSAKIPAGAVVASDVADGSVTTAKLADNAVTSAKALNLGRRNIVINGAMQVAQRGTSATGKGASSNFLVDRFKANHNGNSAGRYTVSQVADVHDGFASALKFDCTTADTSIGSSERFFIEYPMEGQDLQQFRKGSSDAKDFVVSFYAKANGNFTYVVGFYDADNNRTVSRTFAVTSSWQRFTINFGADTAGAFGNDNALSLQLRFYLHVGSNYTSASLQTSWNAVNNAATAGGMTSSFYSSTDNTFFLTGVQLEVGDKSDGTSTATDFEHRSFAEELSLCQRYFSKISSIDVAAYHATGGSAPTENLTYLQTMRSAPTCTLIRQSGDSFNLGNINQRNITVDSFNFYVNASSTNQMVAFGHNGKPATYTMEAEL